MEEGYKNEIRTCSMKKIEVTFNVWIPTRRNIMQVCEIWPPIIFNWCQGLKKTIFLLFVDMFYSKIQHFCRQYEICNIRWNHFYSPLLIEFHCRSIRNSFYFAKSRNHRNIITKMEKGWYCYNLSSFFLPFFDRGQSNLKILTCIKHVMCAK